jgi:hypothetical protein
MSVGVNIVVEAGHFGCPRRKRCVSKATMNVLDCGKLEWIIHIVAPWIIRSVRIASFA